MSVSLCFHAEGMGPELELGFAGLEGLEVLGALGATRETEGTLRG